MWLKKWSFAFVSYLLFLCMDGVNCTLVGRVIGESKEIANDVVGDVASLVQSKQCRMNTYQTIRYYGFLPEAHFVQTEDGYRLTLFRCNSKNSTMCNKRVAVLVHGIASSSDDYCDNPPGHGLAYIMAAAGYDVWLINCRGNTFSRCHTHLDPDDPLSGFWKFSWDDMALKDFPACINYIRRCTKQNKLYWVAHSQGTSATMALLSEKPEYNQYMQAVCLLAPVGYLRHTTALLQIFGPIERPLEVLKNLEFFPRSAASFLAGIYCQSLGAFVCDNILKIFAGQSKCETNYKLLPIHLCHTPSGTSSTQLLHYAQEIKHGHFGRRMIGNQVPCDFPLHCITAPLFLQYSTRDAIADAIDVEILLTKLIGSCDLRANKITKPFNHVDFLWGNNAPELIYTPMLKFFDDHC